MDRTSSLAIITKFECLEDRNSHIHLDIGEFAIYMDLEKD